MPDIQELSQGDMAVAERMRELPDSVLFGEESEDPKAGQERSDDPEAPDEIQDGPEASADAQEAEADKGEMAEPGGDDPEFEIANPDGGEARKVKLSELLQTEREFTAFKTERAQILQREETRAREAASQQVGQVEQWSRGAAYQIHAALQLVREPAAPNIELRNPASRDYDPDRYETEKYHYEQRMGQYRHAQGLAAQLWQQAEGLKAAQTAERETRELSKLASAWPEFVKDDATISAFVGGMGSHYGFSAQELDDILVDHRQALVARDALKWREHEAKVKTAKATVKDKVVQKAAKVDKGQTGQRRELSSEQSSYMNARKALKANGKDMNAAARGFMKFV